jgi:hypothetical protein
MGSDGGVGDGSLERVVVIILGSARLCPVSSAALDRLIVAAVSTVYSHVKPICWWRRLSCGSRQRFARQQRLLGKAPGAAACRATSASFGNLHRDVSHLTSYH